MLGGCWVQRFARHDPARGEPSKDGISLGLEKSWRCNKLHLLWLQLNMRLTPTGLRVLTAMLRHRGHGIVGLKDVVDGGTIPAPAGEVESRQVV